MTFDSKRQNVITWGLLAKTSLVTNLSPCIDMELANRSCCLFEYGSSLIGRYFFRFLGDDSPKPPLGQMGKEYCLLLVKHTRY